MTKVMQTKSYVDEVGFDEYIIRVVSRELSLPIREEFRKIIFSRFWVIAHPFELFDPTRKGFKLESLKTNKDITNGPSARDHHEWICDSLMHDRRKQDKVKEAIGLELYVRASNIIRPYSSSMPFLHSNQISQLRI